MKQVLVKTGIVLILSCNAVQVQAAPADMLSQQSRIDQIEQQQSAKRQAREERERINAPNVRLTEKNEKIEYPELPEEKVSFLVKDILVECDIDKFDHLKASVVPYEHHKIGVQGINIVAKVLSDHIIAEGYVTTRVVVPEQDLSSGLLRLKIIPGYIQDIRFEKTETYGTWRNAFPTAKGDVLNIRRLEQGLEQMKRIPNQDADMKLLPGTELGETEIVISIRRTKPWMLGLSVDDSGIKSTGRLQAGISAAVYNPFGLNDVISYNYGKDAEHNDRNYGSDNYSFSYSVPYGDYTFSFTKYRNQYHQTIADIVPFRYDGKTDGMELGVQKLVYRDRTRKTQLTFKVLRKDRHTYLDGEELIVQHQKTTAYQGGILHRQYWGPTTMDLQLYYQKGMPWWGAEPGYSDSCTGMATTRYGLWGANFNMQTPVKLGSTQGRYRFSFRGQYTRDMLYGSDQFSIGGRYSVRGFDGELTLAAENGFYIQNELSIPVKNLNIEPYLGIDYGQVWGPSAEYLLGRKLAGAVCGIRGAIGKNFQYDAFIGRPIYKPEGFKTGKTVLGFSTYMYI